jgi:hypothetical protein
LTIEKGCGIVTYGGIKRGLDNFLRKQVRVCFMEKDVIDYADNQKNRFTASLA